MINMTEHELFALAEIDIDDDLQTINRKLNELELKLATDGLIYLTALKVGS